MTAAVGPVLGPDRRPAVSEADWQQQVIDYARLCGWLVHAERPARAADGWRTPIQGDKGYPDLTLVRDRVVFAELKSPTGPLRPDQRLWLIKLRAAGVDVRVWRPVDWPEVEETLRRRT